MPVEDAFDDGYVTEVIRPAAILPEEAARAVLVELSARDVSNGGLWQSDPRLWTRFDRPWEDGQRGRSQLVGSIQVAYGTPTRYEITVYRVTVTRHGTDLGWTVQTLCDEALGFGGIELATCPRAALLAPPKPFRY
ncbi:hypothetical protein EV189_1445 [Motilibacter rhizosphaerae]|uniref:Uncharacterized protein n=1 Tax=Motilibacter rhizosphaerae TaxID=598652 RepID=A0A4Q7NRX5_9ACTN|nr:hypothetical protein [Motilibacter rhizosphaerae]RZS89674.1 hypothetical protein EV189_1445 [Motilibacter rhizosphaerae]